MQLIRSLNVHHRLTMAGLLAALTYGLLPHLSFAMRALCAWDVGAGTYLLLAWLTISGANSDITRTSTQTLRQSGSAVMSGVLLAALISAASLVFLFKSAQAESAGWLLVHVSLTFLALGFSWFLIHTRFAFHYAHRYYNVPDSEIEAGSGLQFPGNREPDYLDFAYFSLVIGMTSQVSDVIVTSRQMRRLVLMHGVLSFGFNVIVVALSVNIFASLIA
ncbi:MAG: DUF1345 domain-containing protein [Thiobacillus sp.]